MYNGQLTLMYLCQVTLVTEDIGELLSTGLVLGQCWELGIWVLS